MSHLWRFRYTSLLICLGLEFLGFALGMIAGMLYFGVMLIAFVPIFCAIIVLSAGTIVYLRFRSNEFQIFHTLYPVRKASEASVDPPPKYEIAITMPTVGDIDRDTV